MTALHWLRGFSLVVLFAVTLVWFAYAERGPVPRWMRFDAPWCSELWEFGVVDCVDRLRRAEALARDAAHRGERT